MAADSVGQIGLDLVVNKGGFDKQMKGIQGLAAKAGKTLAAAFAVKKLVDFGAQCIELGSDLSEVQNVVDVTFPRMKKRVDEFAQNAAKSFGLSETMAKRYTGTFGAMAKAFGFNEKAAYDMSTTLTGLAGDVASFYNLSQDEAYTKLKSVFTGETESLKDLGVVMTQAALDQYALANGFGKTTQSMGEAEKVALRYKFVQDQLSLASGDFIRTSDGWANQMRILKLQFESLKATIGQGLINVLTPVIKVINSIIGKLMSLANAFRAFTELITGKKGSGGGASAAAAGMEAVAETADNAGAAMGAAGGAAKKATKQLSDIDKLHVINTDSGSGGSSGGGAGGSEYNVDDFDMGEMGSSMDEMENRYQSLFDKAKELANLFKKGFANGLGDMPRFDTIRKSIDGIKDSLKEIFTDPEVASAADRFADSFAYSLGQVVGSMASIGVTIAANLTGGLAGYLQEAKSRIKEYLIDMFDIGSEISLIVGNFFTAFAEVFSVFAGENGQAFTASLIGFFANSFMGVTELFAKLGRDILNALLTPFTNNTEGFKAALDGLLGVAAQIMGDIKDIFTDSFDKINQVYDEHIGPMFNSFTEGLTEIYSVALEAFNTHILPALQDAADRFSSFKDEHLQPLIDKFLEFGGKVADTVAVIWDNALKPFVEWAINTLAPMIAEAIRSMSDEFGGLMEVVAEVAGNLLDALGGILEFIQGVFTGDTEKALNGLKDIFKGVFNGIIVLVEKAVNRIVEGLNKLSFDVPDWSPVGGGKHFGFDINPISLPRLANGGYVKANTPRLAMIGDNRREGEIVAPESKLKQLLDAALKANSGNTPNTMEMMMLMRDMVALLKIISQKDPGQRLSDEDIFEAVQSENRNYKKQHGKPAFT